MITAMVEEPANHLGTLALCVRGCVSHVGPRTGVPQLAKHPGQDGPDTSREGVLEVASLKDTAGVTAPTLRHMGPTTVLVGGVKELAGL